MNNHRELSSKEIKVLQNNGCTAEDWQKISVSPNFSTDSVANCRFSGEIKLGEFANDVSFFGGVSKKSGLYNVHLHNCTVGDNVYIADVGNYISNYEIGENTVIENIDLLAVEGENAFGNGEMIAVLIEAGGREIPMFDWMSAHLAYLMALYRHKTTLVSNLENIIAEYVESVKSTKGSVGSNCKIINSRIIKNVNIKTNTTIEGVNRLENGSINSCEEDPVYIGPGVIAENFIISSGSKITDGTLLSHCFVGQNCDLSKQYSAEHSVFFANCLGYHGEACSIFAGPYTVSHHKTSLLIAGYFSFTNAGSGSNQSNHMYKLGPIHQGIVERGSKTTSDSYLLWPAKVGAFTLVMGRHYRNSDTTNLPFSYLIESDGESVLIPGVNLRSVGTIRDAIKWPNRDKRKASKKLDYINFNLLSPYTIERMLKGVDLLQKLKQMSGETSDFFSYQSVKIKNSSLNKGINYYQMGINKFLGNSLIKRLEKTPFESNEKIRECLAPSSDIGKGKWVDLAGLITPISMVENLIQDIENETIKTVDQIDKAFKFLHDNYYNWEWTWAAGILEEQLGKPLSEMTANDVIYVVKLWKESVIGLDNMLLADAQKEFSKHSQIGYGVDFENYQEADFQNVRGEFEKDSFVLEIKDHIRRKSELGDELINRLEKNCKDLN